MSSELWLDYFQSDPLPKLRFMCDASGNRDDVYIDAIEWRGMSGSSSVGNPIVLTKHGEMIAPVPDEFLLSQNHPNPFNPSTVISFGIEEAATVRMDIYNILGQKVETLINERLEAGEYHYEWNATGMPSGIYFYRLNAGEITETRKMILLK